MAGVPLAVGTVLPVGADTPPTTTAKATASFLYGLVPVVLGALVTVLQSTDTLWPDAPPWVKALVPVVLILLGPISSYFGAIRTPNQLEQSVQIVDTPGEHAAPEV